MGIIIYSFLCLMGNAGLISSTVVTINKNSTYSINRNHLYNTLKLTAMT